MAELTVHSLCVATDAEWFFEDSMPSWRHRKYGSRTRFDPFPAYPHEMRVVEEAAEVVADTWAPLWNVELYVADREEITRSNGHSNVHEGGHYEGDTYVKDEPVGLIVLSGKRVPPHPSMTRYLVAHEYGHNVEWMINRSRGRKTIHDDSLMREYADVRGLPGPTHHGSGGRWHDSITEVFACDFRIIVCDVEPQYWPHPGIPHPLNALDDLSGLAAWWDDMGQRWFEAHE